MPWPVYLALKQLFPSGRVSFFTVLAVLGVMLGVTLLIVSRSIMGGFAYQIRAMIIDTQGEVQVQARAPLTPDLAARVEKSLSAESEVAAFAPYASGFVMIENERRPIFPAIQGFDLERMKKVIPLERYLVAGTLDDVDDDSVILSAILAQALGAGVGDTVSIYTPLMAERAKQNEVVLPREVRVAAIFQIGHQQLDSSLVICSLRLMQDLYGLKQEIHGFNVRLRPGADEFVVASRLNAALPPGTRALTWFETNADFQSVISFENNMLTFMMSFIVLVAGFAITTSLLSAVVRKTREIGLIAAMGGRGREVAACFCFQGLIVGILGASSGLVFSLLVLHYRDGIVRVLTRFTMGQDVFERFYQLSRLPAHTTAREVAVILASSVCVATLAGLLPAWRAARLKPVEALRSE